MTEGGATTMTLGELRKQLAAFDGYPDDTPVVLSKDAEGNGFSPLEEVIVGMYAAETTWSGEWYMLEAERRAQERPDDWGQAPDDAVEAVFLWPVN